MNSITYCRVSACANIARELSHVAEYLDCTSGWLPQLAREHAMDAAVAASIQASIADMWRITHKIAERLREHSAYIHSTSPRGSDDEAVANLVSDCRKRAIDFLELERSRAEND